MGEDNKKLREKIRGKTMEERDREKDTILSSKIVKRIRSPETDSQLPFWNDMA